MEINSIYLLLLACLLSLPAAFLADALLVERGRPMVFIAVPATFFAVLFVHVMFLAIN